MAELSRHKARENAFLAQFSKLFGGSTDEVLGDVEQQNTDYELDAFACGLLLLYDEHAEEVDRQIETHLKGWTLQRITRVNRAILQLSAAEILFSGHELDSVIINEAVELAKRFGDETDYQFVNGVLGNIVRGKQAPEAAPTEV